MISILYLNEPEEVIKKCKHIEKRVYKALKIAFPLGCRNISK